MTEGRRFQVIDGEGEVEPARRPSSSGFKRYGCSQCSDELGIPFSRLIKVIEGGCEENGKLVAGTFYWACARCYGLKFHIRTFARKPGQK